MDYSSFTVVKVLKKVNSYSIEIMCLTFKLLQSSQTFSSQYQRISNLTLYIVYYLLYCHLYCEE